MKNLSKKMLVIVTAALVPTPFANFTACLLNSSSYFLSVLIHDTYILFLLYFVLLICFKFYYTASITPYKVYICFVRRLLKGTSKNSFD